MIDSPGLSSSCYDMLRQIKSNPLYNPSEGEPRRLVLYLNRAGLITDFIPPYGRRLTPKGEEALRLEDERLAAAQEAAKDAYEESQREAEEKAEEKSRSWWQFWLGLILGWLLGCITPGDVISFFTGLLH